LAREENNLYSLGPFEMGSDATAADRTIFLFLFSFAAANHGVVIYLLLPD
jgi:hypothetical protein